MAKLTGTAAEPWGPAAGGDHTGKRGRAADLREEPPRAGSIDGWGSKAIPPAPLSAPGRIRTCAAASGGRDPVCARGRPRVLPAPFRSLDCRQRLLCALRSSHEALPLPARHLCAQDQYGRVGLCAAGSIAVDLSDVHPPSRGHLLLRMPVDSAGTAIAEGLVSRPASAT